MSEIDQIRRLAAANSALTEQLAECRAKNLTLAEMNAHLKAESDWDRKQLRVLRTSLSWRLTAPIRIFKRKSIQRLKKLGG